MQSTSKSLSQKIRAQSAELNNLADAIDVFARQRQIHLCARGRLKARAIQKLGDAGVAPLEDYSDLLPNPPDDPTAWRGALFRRQRNEKTRASKSPFSAHSERPSE